MSILRIRTSTGWSTFATYHRYNDAYKAGHGLIQNHEADAFGIIEDGDVVFVEAGVWGVSFEEVAD